jgi:predicted Zn-dependent protease
MNYLNVLKENIEVEQTLKDGVLIEKTLIKNDAEQKFYIKEVAKNYAKELEKLEAEKIRIEEKISKLKALIKK